METIIWLSVATFTFGMLIGLGIGHFHALKDPNRKTAEQIKNDHGL